MERNKKILVALIVILIASIPVGLIINSVINDYQAEAARDKAVEEARIEEEQRQARFNVQLEEQEKRDAANEKRWAKEKADRELKDKVDKVKTKYNVVTAIKEDISTKTANLAACREKHPTDYKNYCGEGDEKAITYRKVDLKSAVGIYNTAVEQAQLDPAVLEENGLPPKLDDNGNPVAP